MEFWRFIWRLAVDRTEIQMNRISTDHLLPEHLNLHLSSATPPVSCTSNASTQLNLGNRLGLKGIGMNATSAFWSLLLFYSYKNRRYGRIKDPINLLGCTQFMGFSGLDLEL